MTEENLDDGQNANCRTSFSATNTVENEQLNLRHIVNVKEEREEEVEAEQENALPMTEYVACSGIKTESPDCLDVPPDTSSNDVQNHMQPPEPRRFSYNEVVIKELREEQTQLDDADSIEINDEMSVEYALPIDPLHVKDDPDYNFAAALCPYCKIQLENGEYLEYHMIHCHQKSSRSDPVNVFESCINQDGDYECATCPYKTKEKFRFEQHLEGHDEAKKFQCNVCFRLFKFARNLKTHLQYNHVDDWRYKCDKCPYKAKRKEYLQAHIRVHNRNKFQCDECFKHFVSEDNLKDHKLAQHTGERPFKCDMCQYNSKDKYTLQKHQRIHEKYKHQCEVCFKFFVSAYRLQEHQYSHSGVKPFSCLKCPYQARKLDHLKQHVRVHDDEKRFQCEICGNYFKSTVTLKKHQQLHSVERPFACDRCEYKGKSMAQLRQHLNAHDHIKKFQCQTCFNYFKSADGMRKHEQSHRHERPFSCQRCPYTTKRMDCLRQHQRVHDKEDLSVFTPKIELE